MLSTGEHLMWIAKQMGHTDWTMIARVYGRWMPSSQNDAGAKAEALFSIEILGKASSPNASV
jgi:integrase